MFTVFNLPCIKTEQLKLDLTEENQAWVEFLSILRLFLCAVSTSPWPEQKYKPNKSVGSGMKKETCPFTTRLLKVFSSNLFAVWGFWWKSTAWYILNNQNHIVSNRIGPNSYLDTIFGRVADFSWYILFLSSLQEKQSRELFWLITQEERFHFGVFSEKLKLTKSSVPSLITFNCDIKFPNGFLSL